MKKSTYTLDEFKHDLSRIFRKFEDGHFDDKKNVVDMVHMAESCFLVESKIFLMKKFQAKNQKDGKTIVDFSPLLDKMTEDENFSVYHFYPAFDRILKDQATPEDRKLIEERLKRYKKVSFLKPLIY
jgi:hypothetical protein